MRRPRVPLVDQAPRLMGFFAVVDEPLRREVHYVQNCRLLRCPLRWDALTETEEPGVKHCSSCEKNVYFCENLDDARERAANNQCVAIHSSVFVLQERHGSRPAGSGPVQRLPYNALDEDIIMGEWSEGLPGDSEFAGGPSGDIEDSGPSIDVPAYVKRWRERATKRR